MHNPSFTVTLNAEQITSLSNAIDAHLDTLRSIIRDDSKLAHQRESAKIEYGRLNKVTFILDQHILGPDWPRDNGPTDAEARRSERNFGC